jgi:hypothetical protein
MKNKMILRIPRVELKPNGYIQRLYTRNQWVFKCIPWVWALWIALVPVSFFPLSLQQNRLDTLVVPDFGTGKFYTKYRYKGWDIDMI